MKKIFQFALMVAAITMTACVGKFTRTETITEEADTLPWYENMEALNADLKAAENEYVS